MIRRSIPSRTALALGLALLAFAGQAAAAPGPKEAEARKALKQAIEEDYFETRFDDAERTLRKALQTCGTSDCSVALRAEIHATLAAVLAAGKKQLEDAREEFVAALQLDPKIQPDPSVAQAEVTFAYEQARKQLKLPPIGADAKPPDAKPPEAKPPEPPPKPKTPEPTPDDPPKRPRRFIRPIEDDTPKEPEPPPPPARNNWFTLSFAPDISVVSGSNVCTVGVQSEQRYVCVRKDGSRYLSTPTKDNADNINPGLALATLRLMIGYDRILVENLSLGARVGFAFNGASGVKDTTFVPAHIEGRIGYWPGKNPFSTARVRPYIMASGGFAQIDTKVSVQVLEDGNACGAANPKDTASPCTKPSGAAKDSDGKIEERVQTLTAYKQAGLGFASLNFGVQFVPTPLVALHLAVRGSITFPVVTGVLSPELGIAFGF